MREENRYLGSFVQLRLVDGTLYKDSHRWTDEEWDAWMDDLAESLPRQRETVDVTPRAEYL